MGEFNAYSGILISRIIFLRVVTLNFSPAVNFTIELYRYLWYNSEALTFRNKLS